MTAGVQSSASHFMLRRLDGNSKKYEADSGKVETLLLKDYGLTAAQMARLERMRVIGNKKLERILGIPNAAALGISSVHLLAILEANRPGTGALAFRRSLPERRIERKE